MQRFAVLGLATLFLSFTGMAAADAPSPRMACAADVTKLCAGLQPGNGAIRQCIQSHRDQLSDGCKAAIAAAMAARQNAGSR
jgi:hypothetical protein